MDIRWNKNTKETRVRFVFITSYANVEGNGMPLLFHFSSISSIAGGKEERGFSFRINIPYPFSLSFLNSFAKKKKKERTIITIKETRDRARQPGGRNR